MGPLGSAPTFPIFCLPLRPRGCDVDAEDDDGGGGGGPRL